jgi:hypothetical protein
MIAVTTHGLSGLNTWPVWRVAMPISPSPSALCQLIAKVREYLPEAKPTG